MLKEDALVNDLRQTKAIEMHGKCEPILQEEKQKKSMIDIKEPVVKMSTPISEGFGKPSNVVSETSNKSKVVRIPLISQNKL